jgi:arginine-tRNA-protein transferase
VVVEGYHLEQTETKCPYLENRLFTSNNLIINIIDEEGIEAMLESGYRHFGAYFFRPECTGCHECHPIRIPINDFSFSGSEKRVLKRAAHFTVKFIDRSVPDIMKFNLYRDHKRRFKEVEIESYENWVSSFFSDQSFNKTMEIWDCETLAAVTHLDVTRKMVSAVYCYWNEAYASFSPGKLSILLGIQMAMEAGAEYYYLGYYIRDNIHMSYKANYRPNQILEDGVWQ